MDLLTMAELFGNFGEFIGAIAVVLTLAYLAIQVRHSKVALDANTHAVDESRKHARADAVRQIAYRWNEILHNATGTSESASIFVRGHRDLHELDEAEQAVYSSQLVPFLTHHLYVLQVAREGYLGDEVVGEDMVGLLDMMIGDMLRNHPGARAWWRTLEHCWPHREYVNALLEAEPHSDRWSLGSPLVRSDASDR